MAGVKSSYDDPEIDRQLRKGGIVKKRKFTDVACTILFPSFLGAWLSIVTEATSKAGVPTYQTMFSGTQALANQRSDLKSAKVNVV